jgi:hypothetical protein
VGSGLAFETWVFLQGPIGEEKPGSKSRDLGHLLKVCNFIFASNPGKSTGANRRPGIHLALKLGDYNERDHEPGPRHKATRV